MAKTSGTVPTCVLPDGAELPVERVVKAHVSEQAQVVALGAAHAVDALVIECMALQPALQAATERYYVQATHGVVTNVGPDHLDVMGPTERDVALALAGAVPRRAMLFTAEDVHLPVLRAAARDRQTQVVAVGRADRDRVTAPELARFAYIEHAQNVALALRVCVELGVDRETALQGMWAAQPDPGAMTTHTIRDNRRVVHFVSAFAANDPRSTERAWRLSLARFPDVQRRLVLVNCRADRIERSGQLGRHCARWREADSFLVMGRHTSAFTQAALAAGLDPKRVSKVRDQSPRGVLNAIRKAGDGSCLAVGVGNMGRLGLDFVGWLEQQEANA